jgi:glyoxylase-like metal-dependent hydrolase (beta-lactamase superfamily II)
MAIGDVFEVDVGAVSGVHYVDVGVFGAPERGAVYVIDAARPAIVDAGMGTNYELVIDALESVGVAPDDLEVIALTHVHLDHAGGAGYLARACPDADVYVHPNGAPHVADPERLVEGTKAAVGAQWEHYAEPVPVPEERIVEVEDGDAVDLGDRALDVHHAPGHAPHQVVFHDASGGIVYTADAAGIYVPEVDAVVPTSPPPNFDLEGCLEDVGTIRALEPDVLGYYHFGPAETGERLAEYESVLARWVEEVEAAREELPDDEAVIERVARSSEVASVWGDDGPSPEVVMDVRGVLTYLDRREERSGA